MMEWSKDTPGQAPSLVIEPEREHPSKPKGQECLRCGGSPIADWDPECEHVTRESIRERLRALVLDVAPEHPDYPEDDHGRVAVRECVRAVFGCGGERYWQAFRLGGGALREHPTREGAISLVLDTLVEREVEKIRCPLIVARVPEGADLKEVKSALTSLGSKGVGTLSYRVEIEGWPQERTTNPPHALGHLCTCGDERCTMPKPFEVGDVAMYETVGAAWHAADVVRVGTSTVGVGQVMLESPRMAAGWVVSKRLRHATPTERSEYEARELQREDESAHPPVGARLPGQRECCESPRGESHRAWCSTQSNEVPRLDEQGGIVVPEGWQIISVSGGDAGATYISAIDPRGNRHDFMA